MNLIEQHMWEQYRIDIVPYKKIWQEIKEYHDTERQEVFLEYWKPLLSTLKSEIDRKFDKIYNLYKTKMNVNDSLHSK